MSNTHPIINNPNDPLLRVGDTYQKALLERLGKEASGFSAEAVIGASINLLVNVLRQSYSNRQAAEVRYDELVGKTKAILLEHYDSVTGKRKSNFAYTQTVQAAHVKSDDNIN